MTFPTIPTGGRVLWSTNLSPAGTHTFPSLSSLTKNSGDLLIAIIIQYDGNSTNAEYSAWGGSFTEMSGGDNAGTATMAIGAAYKWSTGSETGTFTVTSADTSTNDSVCVLLSIPGAHVSTPPEAGSFATGTAPDSASFNPAGWGTEDTLWISVGGSGEDSAAGSYTGIGTAPTNYSSQSDSGITADVVGGVEGSVAFRQLNAASENPGAWSMDTSNARGASLVIAVRPDNSVTGTGAPSIDEMTISASGVMHASGTGAVSVDEMTVAASGSEGFTGTSALVVDEAAVAASGAEGFTGTGDVTADEAVLAATGTHTDSGISGSGALTIDEATVDASGSEGFAGTGALTVDEAAVAASGAEGFTGTGAVAADEVEFQGSGITFTPVTGTAGIEVPEVEFQINGLVIVPVSGTGGLIVDEITVAALGGSIRIAGSALDRPIVYVSRPPNRPSGLRHR